MKIYKCSCGEINIERYNGICTGCEESNLTEITDSETLINLADQASNPAIKHIIADQAAALALKELNPELFERYKAMEERFYYR